MTDPQELGAEGAPPPEPPPSDAWGSVLPAAVPPSATSVTLPATTPPAGGPHRLGARRLVSLIVAGLLMVVVIGSLGFFVANDLGLRTTVHSLTAELGSARASASADQLKITGQQTQLGADQWAISSLKAQIPTQPNFIVSAQGWQGPCGAYSCYPDGSFVNTGQAGEAVAIFKVTASSGSSAGSVLATCSASLPMTPENGTADASCTASSANLNQYFDDDPSGQVGLTVSVQNP